MNWSLFEQVKKYLENKKRQKAWKKIVMSMAVVVVFVTTYMLILPALTLTKDDVDLTDHITSVTVSKLENGEWKPAEEFTEGDTVRVHLEYILPKGTVEAGSDQNVYYQLPKGVAPTKAETGKVYQGSTEVGDYEIGTDGMIKIKFNNDFNTGDALKGYLNFEGTVSKSGTGEEEKIDFGGKGGSITVKKDTENYDINVKKESSIIAGQKIKYTVTVSSDKGTGENKVTIKDSFTDNKTAIGSYDAGSFKIYKVDVNGKKTEVTGKTPTISQDADGNANFTIKDLDALEAGEKYVVEYEADAKIKSENGAASVSNKASAQTGTKERTDNNTIEISKAMIGKYGQYDGDKGLILWVIDLNADKKDIGGYTFTDDLPQDLVGEVTIKGSDRKEIGKATIKDNKISYTFPEGSKDSYKIEYYTKAPDKDGQVTNKAEIKKGDHSFSTSEDVDVTHRTWDLKKGCKKAEKHNDQITYQWQSEITLPDTEMGSFTYTDTIEHAQAVAGTSIPEEDSHYAIASQLQKQLEQLKINLKVGEEFKEVGYNNDYVKFDIKYYDKDGKEIEASDTQSKVRKFEIKVTPKNGYEEISGKSITINYSTILNTDGMKQDDTWKITNTAQIPGHTAKSDKDYTKENPIEKQSGVPTDGWPDNGWINYTNDQLNVDYDKTKGILYYRILLRTKADDDGDITVTDTLPEGATFVENSLQGLFYKEGGWQSSVVGNYDFSKNKKITYKIDGQKMTMMIAGGYNSCGKLSEGADGNILAITYEVSVKDDEYWKNVTNENKDYTNKAEWNGESSEQTTTVNKNVEQVEKTGEQLKDENGKLINAVQYKVVINPTAKDLLKNSDWLTLTDTMTIPDKVDAYLDPDQVKLYELDTSKEDNLGEEISADRYQFTYDQATHKMTLKIPDELACVLVYRYDIDAGNQNEPQLNNNVTLSGTYVKNTETKIDTSSSSAGVTKGKITIYKVDGDNYKKLLSGAEFSLEYWNGTTWVKQASQLTTDDNGELTLDVASSDEQHRLVQERLYRLTETKAPDGYQMAKKDYYFIYKGYQSDGSILSDAKVYEKAQGSGSQISQKDINFYGKVGGNLYIPNDYTRISVKKVWTNNLNQAIDPATDGVKVQLYRQKTKLDGCTVTINEIANNGEIVTNSKVIARNSKLTITLDRWGKQQYIITYNGKTIHKSDADAVNGVVTFETDEISSDTVINIECKNAEYGAAVAWLQVPKYQEPNQYTATGDKEKIGIPVTLSDKNNWSSIWDKLEKTDSGTNTPYYYTVEEVDPPKGSKVSYTNNDGIQNGEIIVTNKIEAYQLPETGGTKTTIYTKAGIMLIAAGIMLLYWKRKYQ